MKKITTFLLICSITVISGTNTYGLSFSQEKQLSSIIDMFEARYTTTDKKIQTLKSFNILLNNAKDRVQNDKIALISFLQQETTKRLDRYRGTELGELPYQNVRDQWELLHNNVRKESITQHPKLNRTAQKRAQYLADNQIKAGNTHKRDPQDTYYDYAKIEDRFAIQGVGFTIRDGRVFSESVSYNTVRCTSNNCEGDLATATEKSRSFLYDSEKNSNGPHYRAIIQPNFKYLGIGIALSPDKKWYYIVIHYATDVHDVMFTNNSPV